MGVVSHTTINVGSSYDCPGWNERACVWYYFKRENGKWGKRYVFNLFLRPALFRWLGWQIEDFSKRSHFGLDRFGQQTLLGVYRWLVCPNRLSGLISLFHSGGEITDKGEAAQLALNSCSHWWCYRLLAEIQRLYNLPNYADWISLWPGVKIWGCC